MDAGRRTPLASVLSGRKVLAVRICSDLALSSITPIPSSEFVAEDLPSLAKSPSASLTMPSSRYVTSPYHAYWPDNFVGLSLALLFLQLLLLVFTLQTLSRTHDMTVWLTTPVVWHSSRERAPYDPDGGLTFEEFMFITSRWRNVRRP